MAQSDLSGFNGSVTLPSGHGGAAKGFTVKRSATKKNVGRYASGSRFTKSRLGAITVSGQINVFLQMGAANTSPGLSPAADGATLTLTLETGCSLSGTAVFPDLDITHVFDDAAIEGTHGYEFSGTVTETWAVS